VGARTSFVVGPQHYILGKIRRAVRTSIKTTITSATQIGHRAIRLSTYS